jgi:hypothetical protein
LPPPQQISFSHQPYATGGPALAGQMAPITLVPLPAPCFTQEGSIKTIGSDAVHPPPPFSRPTPSFTSPSLS